MFIGTGVFWGLVVGLLLAAVLIILAAQNDKVTINFLAWEYSTPLIAGHPGGAAGRRGPRRAAGLVYRARRRHTLTDRRELVTTSEEAQLLTEAAHALQGARQGRSCLRLGHLVGVLPGMSISSLERGPCCGGR